MKPWILASALALLISVVGCKPSTDTTAGGTTPAPKGESKSGGEGGIKPGSVTIDGSGTVYPIASLMAEDFGAANSGITVSVNKAGTGSGFKKFIDGSIDIATASRTIEEKEEADCKAKGIEFIEIPIAYDGISVFVNKDNTFVDKLSTEELKKLYGEDSKAKTWADVRAGWPADKFNITGPSDNHGTYEFFTERGLGKKNAIRKEYQAQQEYNTIIQAVEGDKNAIGYVGYSYYADNKDKVKLIPIDGVEPTPETIANGSYKPLGRTLFLYVNKKSADRPEIKKFLEYALSADGLKAVTERQYVLLPDRAYEMIRARIAAGKTGSIFRNAPAGKTTVEILDAAK